jgi:hypothetical protein
LLGAPAESPLPALPTGHPQTRFVRRGQARPGRYKVGLFPLTGAEEEEEKEEEEGAQGREGGAGATAREALVSVRL